MSTEQASLIEPSPKRRGKRAISQNAVHLRLADRPTRNRLQHLVDLAGSLLVEAETLSRDKVFSEQAAKLKSLDLSAGIDFYDEVRRFETGLIKMALEQAGGNQARAAELLHLKPTTLNSKIKLFEIECCL